MDQCLKLPILSTSDWIDILSIIINVALVGWVVLTMQNKLTNKRVLKDHFINEIKEIRTEYRDFFNKLDLGKVKPKEVAPLLKLINIKSIDLFNLIEQKHPIDYSVFESFHRDLSNLVTEFEEFKVAYKSNSPITLDSQSRNEILLLRQKYNHLFNNIIVKVNDSDN